MRGKRFSEEQIIGILKEAEAGISVTDLSRKHGNSEAKIKNGIRHRKIFCPEKASASNVLRSGNIVLFPFSVRVTRTYRPT